MKNESKIQIIILAAGKGTRMKSDNPKALTPLLNKPFLKHILETISKLNLSIEPVIVVGYQKEKIFEALGENLNYTHQEEQLGTGHAVLSAREASHPEHQTVLVISGDQPMISAETLSAIIQKHQNEKPAITLGTLALPDFNDWRISMLKFGRIIKDKNGKVLKNVEYKDATEEEKEITEVNPALYAFDQAWLWKNIHKLKNENSQKEYYLTDLIKMAEEQNEKIIAVPIKNILEGLQPNSQEELETLENLLKNN